MSSVRKTFVVLRFSSVPSAAACLNRSELPSRINSQCSNGLPRSIGRGRVTVKFSPKISSIRTRCVRETSSLSPKPFGRPKAISIHLSPWTLPLLSTPSTWDFGHRFVLSHFAIIASHFIGDFGRSLYPLPANFPSNSAPKPVPMTHHHPIKSFVKLTTGVATL